ncbi:MAG: sigma-70 family RNA polymerase sigma factor [Verrucomicrobiae bacterium]|nr:sigma-70 family RNA polymerase sigma factor [Verrucomicrobiae bacterium]
MPRLPEDPDAALMLRFRAGEEAAFDALVEKFQAPVYNYILRHVGRAEDAEDLAQNVFVQVARSAPRYQPTARFTTWLFTIARNLCLNEYRRRGRHPLQSLEQAATDHPEAEPPQYADPSARPASETLIEQEFQSRVLAAIRRLPENQRSAVMLCRYEEMPYEEIAKVLGISLSATKSVLHRARETLKRELRDLLE